MSTRGGKAIFGVGLVVFGLAVFMLASAYVIERDLPKWLAAAVGGLAFPVLPVVWHVIGERRRRARLAAAKTQPKNTLAPGDRYLMRAVTVAAAVLVPMFVVGRTKVLRAAWEHKTWFIPDPYYDPIESADEMLAHVPSDADAVVVIRDHEDKTGKKVGVIAYGDHQLAMIALADKDDEGHQSDADRVKQMNDQRDKIPFFKVDKVDLVKVGKGMFAVASERWADPIRVEGAGPRQTIKAALDKAPSDAIMALGYAPAKPDALGIEKMSGWVQQKATNEKMTIEAKLDIVDAAVAAKTVDALRAMWKAQRSELPDKCKDEIGKLADDAQLERTGATITFHLTMEPAGLLGIMMCAIKDAKFGD